MATTHEELVVMVERLTKRVEVLERIVNQLQTVILNMATIEQVNALTLLRQKDIDSLEGRMDEAETAITQLQTEVFK